MVLGVFFIVMGAGFFAMGVSNFRNAEAAFRCSLPETGPPMHRLTAFTGVLHAT